MDHIPSRSTELASEALRSPSFLARSREPHCASKISMSHARTKCARLWFPGKGISWLDLDELVVDKERQSQMRRKELSMFGVYTVDNAQINKYRGVETGKMAEHDETRYL